MTEEWMRRKFAGVDTAPMFDEPAGPTMQTKPKRVKNVDRADCPDCGKNIGLYVLAVDPSNGGRTLAFRRHYKMIGQVVATFCRRSNTEHHGKVN